ncbi:hypothetical protein BDV12DRAFT_200317 [Aspergillus spectabilis]
MALDQENRVRYELLDEKLQLNGRYHRVLRNVSVKARPKAKRSLYARKDLIKPSSLGEYSDLSLTVYERSDGLELRCVASCSGSDVPHSLARAIVSSYGLSESEQCAPSRKNPLTSNRQKDVMATSVAASRANGNKIAVVQTKGNPTAQLLSCERGVSAMILGDSCLNCAPDEAKDKFKMIIVS